MEWCPRCERSVDVEHKVRKLGRSKSLVKVTTTCAKCRMTLNTRTMTKEAAEEIKKADEEIKSGAQASEAEEAKKPEE